MKYELQEEKKSTDRRGGHALSPYGRCLDRPTLLMGLQHFFCWQAERKWDDWQEAGLEKTTALGLPSMSGLAPDCASLSRLVVEETLTVQADEAATGRSYLQYPGAVGSIPLLGCHTINVGYRNSFHR